MDIDQLNNRLNELETGIIKTLLYSGIFEYPLTEEELIRHCQARIADKTQFQFTIESLLQKNLLYHNNGFYQLKDDESQVRKRLQANRLSKRFLPIAFSISKILFRFPYVRGVCLSGSLSKSNFYAGNDIDFFIIAEQKRIWLVRLMITLFRKMLGHKRNYLICTNYFIEKGTMISPMNIFTASELTMLIPTCGKKTYADLINQNDWTKQYFPNYELTRELDSQEEQTHRLKRFIEFSCNNIIFDFVNYAIMKLIITRKKWQINTNRADGANKETFFNTVNSKMIRMNFANDNQSKTLSRFDSASKDFENTSYFKLFDNNE